jgi:peroxiredoxin
LEDGIDLCEFTLTAETPDYNSRAEDRMRRLLMVLLFTSLVFGQTPDPAVAPATPVSPALQLLRDVGARYAEAKSYWIESVMETNQTQELRREWSKLLLSAAEAPSGRYRFAARDSFGEAVIASNSEKAWRYHGAEHKYTEQPAHNDEPLIGHLIGMSEIILSRTRNAQGRLKEMTNRLRDARFLPDETVRIGDREIRCKVVQFTTDDLQKPNARGSSIEKLTYTIWIDAKSRELERTAAKGQSVIWIGGSDNPVPMQMDEVTTYLRAEVDPKFPDNYFTFQAPQDAKLVPEFSDPWEANIRAAKAMIGKPAPDVELIGDDGKKVKLASLRGKPVVLDFWATWCEPCVESLPEVVKITNELKSTPLQWLSVTVQDDQSRVKDFLKKEKITWTNYYDDSGLVGAAFHGQGVPTIVLIDASGNVVFSGSNVDAIRKEIAKLGPEYASIGATPSVANKN